MTIKVITQTTAERKAETRRLYEACRPYLEQGYSIYKAAWKVTGTKPNCSKGHGKCEVDKSCEDFELIGRLSR